MSKTKAIAILAGLAAGGMVLSGSATTEERADRYAVSAAGDGAWRVNTLTGRMVWCQVEAQPQSKTGPTVLRGSGDRKVVCYDENGEVTLRLF